MLVRRKKNVNRTVSVLQLNCVYCYNGAQRYEQFLPVGRLSGFYLLSTWSIERHVVSTVG